MILRKGRNSLVLCFNHCDLWFEKWIHRENGSPCSEAFFIYFLCHSSFPTNPTHPFSFQFPSSSQIFDPTADFWVIEALSLAAHCDIMCVIQIRSVCCVSVCVMCVRVYVCVCSLCLHTNNTVDPCVVQKQWHTNCAFANKPLGLPTELGNITCYWT